MGTHPRERVRTVSITTPPNTPPSAPRETVWAVGRGVVDRLEVVIPDGHAGLTGLAVVWGARQVWPYEAGEWIIGNDEVVRVSLGLYVTDSLVVRTYNVDDTYVHSHHLRAYVVDPERELPLVGTPPPTATLLELPPPTESEVGGPVPVEAEVSEDEQGLA